MKSRCFYTFTVPIPPPLPLSYPQHMIGAVPRLPRPAFWKCLLYQGAWPLNSYSQAFWPLASRSSMCAMAASISLSTRTPDVLPLASVRASKAVFPPRCSRYIAPTTHMRGLEWYNMGIKASMSASVPLSAGKGRKWGPVPGPSPFDADGNLASPTFRQHCLHFFTPRKPRHHFPARLVR